MTKRERKSYKSCEPVWSRYFYINIWKYTKDRYSKGEKKTIKYVSVSRLYFFVNLLCHLVSLAYIVFAIVEKYSALSIPIDKILFAEMLFYLAVFGLFALAEYCMKPTYHKNREKFRRK